MNDYSKIKIEDLSSWFKRFADNECKEVSPMYFFLANHVAEDEDLIRIASNCIYGQPMPNLFFASVQYLLFKNTSSKLASFYPSIFNKKFVEFDFNIFKEFCLKNEKEIIKIEQTKLVQTNALNRSAYLMPILSNLFGSKEISIVDVGTSAGLILNFDKYEYHYNNKKIFGNSKVIINSEIKEGQIPALEKIPIIKFKTGLDQNPIDLKKEDNALWLKALIWADLSKRFKKLNNAIEIALQNEFNIIKAKELDDFEKIFLNQDKSIPLVIYHTHVLYQFNVEHRKAFWNLIDKIGSQRNLTYIAAEGSKVLSHNYNRSGILIELIQYKNGKKTNKLIAETNGHANWIKWLN